MTEVHSKFKRTGLPGSLVARRAPFLPKLRESKASRPVPSPSLRLPVTQANRAYLRLLRQAEMDAWLARPQPEAEARASTRISRSDASRPQVLRLVTGVAVVALLALVVGLLVSPRVPERLTDMVGRVREFLAPF